MKIDGSDFEERFVEQLFDKLLFSRQVASISVERLRIVKELERLLSEEQNKFEEYLVYAIEFCEIECDFSLDGISGIRYDSERDPPAYVDDEGQIVDINNFCYDKNTTMLQYLDNKRNHIIFPLQAIKILWDNKRINETIAVLKEAHGNDLFKILDAGAKIEEGFRKIESLVLETAGHSPDEGKNTAIKYEMEKMRSTLKNDGFNV